MSLIVHVKERLETEVPALTGKLDYVAELAALTDAGAPPQREVSAFVIPLGADDQGGGGATAAGLHTQTIGETVGVILCIKALGDAKARKALPTIDELGNAVTAALAGWGPEDASGVLMFRRGRLVSVTKGLVVYQLEYTLLDQLRIAR
ncbi:phage tail terminator protein [Rhodopseudomonas sp.]|uniref:phage tail terminator protein n=1 Tax=Rhodopseudomonas sp. TaxID=1078 RepID=UPI003B3A374E